MYIQIKTEILIQYLALWIAILLSHNKLCKQGRNRKMFLREQSHFSWFFFMEWNAFSL